MTWVSCFTDKPLFLFHNSGREVIMQLVYLCILSVLFLCSSTVFAQAYKRTVEVNEPFIFKLHTANVFPWITGEKKGHVTGEKNRMAHEMEYFILGAKNNLSVALYGVRKQAWFLHAIKSIKDRKIVIGGVVDQKSGAVGDWLPKNFFYVGTARLPLYFGKENLIVDSNSTGLYPLTTIMHHKYLVADDSSVWSGTVNLSHTGIGAEYNANAALFISSKHISRLYADEFKQMYVHKRFSGSKKQFNIPTQHLFKDGTRVSVYFSPQDDVVNTALVPTLKQAQHSLDIAMFFLTSLPVVREICNASKRGVRVRLILDAVASRHPSSAVDQLRACNTQVKIENWGGKMHMKVGIVDGRQVIVGSMNWSKAGNYRNDENTIFVENNKRLHREMQDYFDKLWETLQGQSDYHKVAPESFSSINSCFDGLDNDHDGLVDSMDYGCKKLNNQVNR